MIYKLAYIDDKNKYVDSNIDIEVKSNTEMSEFQIRNLIETSLQDETVMKSLNNQPIKKIIIVPNKLINFIT